MWKNSFRDLIDSWFAEDIGNGDHTTLSTIPAGAKGSAHLLVKENGILAGVEIAEKIFHHFDEALDVSVHINDGTVIEPGDIALHVEGKVRSILQSERLVLNVMQRMSGIATTTATYVDRLQGTKAKILDTRKTTPGFRAMEKEAVRIGGGVNHRNGLYDMILVKDNHIDFAGGIQKAIERVHAYLDKNRMDLKIEIEVRNLNDIREVMQIRGVDRILLDNFSPELTREAVEMIGGQVETESSGGITLQSIRAYAEAGVDFISAGVLTHHIKSLDLSLKADF